MSWGTAERHGPKKGILVANLRPKKLLDKLTAAIDGNDVSAPSDNRKPVIIDLDGSIHKVTDLVINEDDQIVLHAK